MPKLRFYAAFVPTTDADFADKSNSWLGGQSSVDFFSHRGKNTTPKKNSKNKLDLEKFTFKPKVATGWIPGGYRKK